MPPKKTRNFSELLRQRAREAARMAYAPYSKFHVGAAVATEAGEIFAGVNVENASSGLTLCAERVAVASAVAAGKRKLQALAIYSPQAKEPLFPCGMCLQTLAEFAEDMEIHCGGANGKWRRTTLKALLPRAFHR